MIYIIMCTYNGERFVEDQIASIKKNKTDSKIELVIADDNSKDHTVELCKKICCKLQIEYEIIVNSENKGVIRNFFDTIEYVSHVMGEADYIMLSDQDDVWMEDKIEKSLYEMNKLEVKYSRNIPLLVCGDSMVTDSELNIIHKSFRKSNCFGIDKLDFSHLIMENKVQGCTTLMNKAIIDKMNSVPGEICMHDNWIAFVASAFGKITYIDEPLLKYRQHQSNEKGSTDFYSDVVNKILHLKEQRRIIYSTLNQVEIFYNEYKNELDEKYKNIAVSFYTLDRQGFWEKRVNIIRYHMWKSGLLRNIGMLILI